MIGLVQNALQEIREILESHQVVKAELFGSAADGDFSSSSDIDILVTFSEELPLLDYADNYFSLKDQLELLLKRRVDLLSTRSLKNAALLAAINRTKQSLYAA